MKKHTRKPLISALEPRLLLDGAAFTTAVEVLTDTQLQNDDTARENTVTAVAPVEYRALDASKNNDRREVAFVDTSVEDYQTLLDGIAEGVEIQLINGNQDGIAQIAAWAEQHNDYDAIHILSHGSEGSVQLGSVTLSSENLDQYSEALTKLGASLNIDGDILLYGCEVASGEGKDFISAFAEATQADVAASDDLTGASALNGDWVLERTVGYIESQSIAATSFDNVLAVYDFETTDSTNINGKTALTSTVSGVTLTASHENYDVVALNAGGYGGTSGKIIFYDTSGVPDNKPLTVSFDAAIDITSLRLATGAKLNAGDWTARFTPTGGANSYVDIVTNSNSGSDVILNWTGVTSFTVTRVDGVESNQVAPVLDTINFTVAASDTTPPTVSSVAITSATGAQNSTLNAGDTVTAKVTFDEAVTVSGTPQLALNIGGTTVQANYASGSGSTELLFTYTIQSGQTDANGISVDANGLSLNSGMIQDASANNATLTFSAVTDNSNYQVDAVAPTLSNSGSSNLDLTTATISSTSNEAGSIYYVVTTSNSAPSAAQVVAGQDHNGSSAFKSGNDAAVADTAENFSLTGLSNSKQYYAYFVSVDEAGNQSSVSSTNFTTTSPNAAPTISNAPSDITVVEDVASNVDLSAITFADAEGDNLTVTLTASSGTLTATSGGSVTVGGSGTGALTLSGSAAHINTYLDMPSNIQYAGASNASGENAAAISIKAYDGTTDSATSTVNVDITEINDEPTLTATGSNPTFTESGSAASLFSGAAASTIESGQTFTGLTLTVTNVNDGTNEKLNIDGTLISLTNGNSGTSATNLLGYSVVVSGSTATVALSGGTMSGSVLQTLVDAISYQNDSNTPTTASNRVVTITSLTDSGSNTGSNDNTAALSIASTVKVVQVPPSVTSVTATTANGSYKAGDVVAITVTFSETVNVTGTPQLTLETGTTDRVIDYVSGSGTSMLTFNYTVQAGDTSSDLDYISTSALALNSGTITDTVGNAAILTLASPGAANSLGANKAIVIDTTAPSAPGTPDLKAADDSGSSNSDDLTKNTSGSFRVSGSDGDTITLYDTDDTTVLGTGTISGGNGYVDISVTGLTAGDHTLTAKATDAAGNVSVASSGLTITIDTGAPTLSNSTPADGATNIAPSSDLSLTFSEAISKGTGNITLINTTTGATVETFNIVSGAGDQSGSVTVDGSTLTINPGADLSEATGYAIQVANTAILDSAGNTYAGISDNTTLNFTTGVTDSAAPTFLSIQRANDNVINGATTSFTLTFNEAVNAVASDFELNTTGTVAGTIGTITGSGTNTLTVNVTGISGVGTLGLNLKAGHGVTDLAGNTLATVEPADDEVYTVDTVAPTLISINRLDSATTNATSVRFMAVFSETVTGLDTDDFELTGTAATNASIASITGSGNGYVITVNGVAGDGSLGVQLKSGATVSDSAGTALTATTASTVTEQYTIDNTAPTSTPIIRTNTALSTADTVTFDVTFSEAVANVSVEDFEISGDVMGTITGVTGSGSSYTVTVGSISGDGALGLNFKSGQNIADTAGNSFAGTEPSTDESYTIDNTSPTVASISRGMVNQVKAGTATDAVFTVVFNETVSGVAASDFTVTGNATNTGVSNVSSADGKVFKVTVGGVNGSIGQTVGLNFTGSADDLVSQASTAQFTAGDSYTIAGTLLNEGALTQAQLDAIVDLNRDGTLLEQSVADATQVIIVDSRVPGLVEHAKTANPEADIWLLDGSRSAVEQISEILANYSDLDALHILSHGGVGEIYLGAETVSAVAINQNSATFAAWGNALSDSGDILLYGCNVAQGDTGVAFINQLAQVTDADIAASDDLTGSAELGGDWELEVKSGDVEATSIVLETYEGALAPLYEFDFENATQISDAGVYAVQQTVNAVTLTISSDASSGSANNVVNSGFNSGGISGNFYHTYSIDTKEVTLSFSEAVTVTSLSGTFGGVSGGGGSGPFTWTISNGSQNVQAAVAFAPQVTDFNLSSLGEVTQLTITSNVTTGHDFAIDSIQFEKPTTDTTAPVFESSTPSVSNISTTTMDLTADIDEAGKIYYVVLPSGTSQPTASAVKAGTATGIVTAGNATVSSGAFSNTFSVSGLSAGTTYDIYVVAEDDEGTPNLQAAATKISVTTAVPTITSATYDASTNALVVTGANFGANAGISNDIDVSKLTLTGEGGSTYTLTSANVEIDSATQFTVSLNSADQLFIEGLLNKNGTTAASGTTYNLAAAADWNPANSGNADITGNQITVSNVQTPTITSATYDQSTGVLTVTGANFVHQTGATNDIDVSTLTLIGEGSATYTLTSATDVEITSATEFSVTLTGNEKTQIDALLNKNGTEANGGTVYNLSAADNWNGPITGGNIADLTGNGITVSNVNAAPTISGAFVAQAVNDTATVTPFSSVVLADVDSANLSVTVSLDTAAKGAFTAASLTASGFTDNSNGTYSLASSSIASAQAALRQLVFNPADNRVAPGSTETTTFTITVNDGSANGTDNTTTVVSTSVNDTPTDISLSDAAFSHSEGLTNVVVGSFSATDADTGESFTYSLVAGTGDTDNGKFNINGADLRVTDRANVPAGTYSIRVQVSDGDATYEKAFTITVTDDQAPTISTVIPTDNSTGVSVADSVEITFDENVSLGSSGTITLYDITGNGANSVTIDVTNHSDQLSVAGDKLTINPTSNLSPTNQYAVQLSANALVDSSSNGITAVNDTTTYNFTTGTVDTTAPTVAIVDIADPTQPNAGTVTINFSEQVTGVDISDFTLTLGGNNVDISGLTVAGSGSAYTLDLSSVTATAGTYVLTLNTANITDTSGNGLTAGDSETFIIDTTAPTGVAIVRAGADSINGSAATFTAVFSEAVTGVDAADFTLTGTASGGSISGVTKVSDSVYTVTVTGLSADGTVGVDLNSTGTGITDIADNAISGGITGQQVTFDTAGPTIVAINRDGNETITSESTTFTVSFDEIVSGVDVSDFSLSGGASGTVSSVSGSGTTYQVTVNSISGNGDLRLDLNSVGTGISDAAGNAMTIGFTAGDSLTIDNTAPIVTASQGFNLDEGMASGTVIGQVKATDTSGVSGFSIQSGNDAGYFRIDSSGVLSLTSAGVAAIDYETATSYTLNIVATDVVGQASSAATVTIAVQDINDNAPVFSSLGTASIAENTDVATAIYTVSATDADGTAAHKTLTYSLKATGDHDAFTIDTNTGEVKLKAQADYETKSSYDFTIIASDGMRSTEKAVTLSVTDVNDNTPSISSSAIGSVDENAMTSTVIYTATATDTDGTAANNSISYSLGGTDASLLNIDSSTGEVTLKDSANYEVKSAYSFNVIATDSGAGSLNSSKAVTVSVVDVNETPVANNDTGSATEAGGVNNGTAGSNATGNVLTNDTDVDATDTKVVSAVKFGSTAGTVGQSLTGSYGSLTLNADGSYSYVIDNSNTTVQGLQVGASITDTFTYTLSDKGALTDTASLVITINGVNDNPTQSSNDPSGITESADASAQDLSSSGSVTFEDVDASDVINVTFASDNNIAWSEAGTIDSMLASQLVAGFDVTGTNEATPGSVNWSYSVNDANLDFLGAGETITFSYTVTVTDSQNATATDTVTFTITGTNDAPTVSAAAATSITEAGDASAQDLTDSGTVSFTDIDDTDVIDVTFASDNNIAWSAGTIDSTLASQLVAGFNVSGSDEAAPGSVNWSYSLNDVNLDFLGAGETITFSYTVTVTDSQNATATDTVSFTITGSNDSPVISVVDVSGSITEGATLTDNGSITFADLDLTDRPTPTEVTKSISYLAADGITGLVLTPAQQTIFENAFNISNVAGNTNTGTVNWTYALAESDIDFLRQGETVTAVFTITVTDDESTSISQDVTVVVTGSNDTPTVENSIPNAEGTLSLRFDPITLPANLFADLDHGQTDSLNWTVANLPRGLSFDASTRQISGVPTAGVGTNVITVTATDANGGAVSTAFNIVLEPAPVNASTSAVTQGTPTSAPSTGFEAPDPEINIGQLPAGTVVDQQSANSGFVSEGAEIVEPVVTPPQPVTGPVAAQAAPTPNAAEASLNRISVNVNQAGEVVFSNESTLRASSLSIATLTTQAEVINISISDDLGALNYSATLADGSVLPEWVTVNAATGEISINPPAGETRVNIRISAQDVNGDTRVLELDLDLTELNSSSAEQNDTSTQAYLNLDEQLELEAQQLDEYGSELMKLLVS